MTARQCWSQFWWARHRRWSVLGKHLCAWVVVAISCDRRWRERVLGAHAKSIAHLCEACAFGPPTSCRCSSGGWVWISFRAKWREEKTATVKPGWTLFRSTIAEVTRTSYGSKTLVSRLLWRQERQSKTNVARDDNATPQQTEFSSSRRRFFFVGASCWGNDAETRQQKMCSSMARRSEIVIASKSSVYFILLSWTLPCLPKRISVLFSAARKIEFESCK